MPTLTARAKPRRATASPTIEPPRRSPVQLREYFAAKLGAELGPHDVRRLIDGGSTDFLLLDVRSREGFTQAHLPGAQHIPLDELAGWLQELPKDQEVITYCWNATCLASTQAALMLTTHGFRARVLCGGISAWQADGFAVERGAWRASGCASCWRRSWLFP